LPYPRSSSQWKRLARRMAMREEKKSPPADRRYPPFWERAVPIALGVIAVVIVILLLIAMAVVLGWFPGATTSSAGALAVGWVL
jgi:hypothetical protein